MLVGRRNEWWEGRVVKCQTFELFRRFGPYSLHTVCLCSLSSPHFLPTAPVPHGFRTLTGEGTLAHSLIVKGCS